MGSPVQEHRVAIANDLQWTEGKLETLGSPHNYINQENLTIFSVTSPLVAPWSFTGLPNSHPSAVYLSRENIQFLVFPDDETVALLRQSPHHETLIINLPGSPNAVKESLGAVLDVIPHAIEKSKGDPSDCAPLHST